jgi:AcrR family transcriptional regulator
MSRTPGPQSGAATRARLVEAAFELFTTRGFLRTTTPAIAARAETAEGTIYRHFKSKEQLLNACHRVVLSWALETLRAADPGRPPGAREQMAALAREFLARGAERPAEMRLLLTAEHEPFLEDGTRALRRSFAEGLVQLVAMGKSDGVVRSGPAEVWAAVWLAVLELAVGRVASGEWAADGANAQLVVDAAWDAIAAPERPSAPAPP